MLEDVFDPVDDRPNPSTRRESFQAPRKGSRFADPFRGARSTATAAVATTGGSAALAPWWTCRPRGLIRGSLDWRGRSHGCWGSTHRFHKGRVGKLLRPLLICSQRSKACEVRRGQWWPNSFHRTFNDPSYHGLRQVDILRRLPWFGVLVSPEECPLEAAPKETLVQECSAFVPNFVRCLPQH